MFKQAKNNLSRNQEPLKVSNSPKPNEPLKVILDSNAFFVPLELKIDIFEETKRLLNRNLDFVLLSPVNMSLSCLQPRTRLKRAEKPLTR